jgi:diaminopimelate epimerase
MISLTKYQALGNDYLVLDVPRHLSELLPLVPRLCNRQRGVGSDGLLVLDPTQLSVRIFNPDGSESERSGNGLRIAAAHAVLEHGARESFRLLMGGHAASVRVTEASSQRVVSEIDVGQARFPSPGTEEISTPVGSVNCCLVEIGNPHCVVLDEPVSPQLCRELGPHLERHPRFPKRTNVQLAEAVSPTTLRCEIWERGAGYTLASGTSAAAVAAAFKHLGRTEDQVEVLMPGGRVAVRCRNDWHVIQVAPAERVFRALIETRDFC